MTERDILTALDLGEAKDWEFKSAKGGMPGSLWDQPGRETMPAAAATRMTTSPEICHPDRPAVKDSFFFSVAGRQKSSFTHCRKMVFNNFFSPQFVVVARCALWQNC